MADVGHFRVIQGASLRRPASQDLLGTASQDSLDAIHGRLTLKNVSIYIKQSAYQATRTWRTNQDSIRSLRLVVIYLKESKIL